MPPQYPPHGSPEPPHPAPGTPPTPTPSPVYGAPLQPLPPASPVPAPSQPNYDFILSPPPSPRKSLLPTHGLLNRVALFLGGLLVLTIILIGLTHLLSTSNFDVTGMISVAEDQQELLHLFTESTPNVSQLSVSTTNFIGTGQLSITTEQNELVKYLSARGTKLKAAQLALKQSAAKDSELTAALGTGTYEQMFSQIIQSELTTYKQDLLITYNATKETSGRTLLRGDYRAATLMLNQINSPTS